MQRFSVHRYLLGVGAAVLAASIVLGCAHAPVAVGHDASLPIAPVAAPGDTVETINGYTVRDPYRSLETFESAAAWIDAQNARTSAYLDRLPERDVAEHLGRFMRIGYVDAPSLAGRRLFYLKRAGDAEKGSLYVREGDVERLLVDPMVVDPAGGTEIDWFYPSLDGGLLAYGLSRLGDENSTLHLMNTDGGGALPDQIPDTRHSSVAWLPDASGFYYTRYPAGDRYNRRPYFHRLGDDPAADTPITPPDVVFAPTDWPSLYLADDQATLVMELSTSYTNNDVYLLSLADSSWRTVIKGRECRSGSVRVAGGSIYFITELNAPTGRLAQAPLNNPGVEHWRTLLAASSRVLEGVLLVGDALVVQSQETAVAHLDRYRLDGASAGPLTLPTLGSLAGLTSAPGSSRLVAAFTSYLYPPTLLEADLAAPDPAFTPLVQAEHADFIDPNAFEVQHIRYPSYDGTLIPLFLVHRKGMTFDGRTPAILDGYGGFGVSMGPYFSRNTLFWVERGGLYAVANLRGGGEMGEEWHQAGAMNRKFQVFQDFQYAMRFLVQEGYTSVDHLAIRGGSNGGLLMGAMMTQAPHLFRCAIASVGLFDMVRFHLFPPGALWSSEYGSADNPAQTGYLWAYSPYHQVLPGVRYPAALIDTALEDGRVHWNHSAKFAAALQAATSGNDPILFWLEKGAGHGFGKTATRIVNEYARKFRFIMHFIGDPRDVAPPAPAAPESFPAPTPEPAPSPENAAGEAATRTATP